MNTSNYKEFTDKQVFVKLNRFDMKLLVKPCVISLSRLSPKLVFKYDKPFYNRYYNHINANNSITAAKNKSTFDGKTSLWCGRNNNSNDIYKQFELLLCPTNAHTNHEEPESSESNIHQNMRYLGLISANELANRTPNEINRFPIRFISRCDHDFGRKTDAKTVLLNKKIILNDIIRNYWLKKCRNQKYRTKKPKTKRFRYDVNIKRKYKSMDERKRQRNGLSEREIEEKLTKILENEVFTYVSKTSFSSPLGQRLNAAILSDSNDEIKGFEPKITSLESYGPFCSTKSRFVSNSNVNDLNEWNCSTIENMCFNSEMTPNHSSNYAHKYSFNRTQRLEKLVRFETGLSWRSRLLSLQCKPLKLKPIIRSECVLCNHRFIDEHVCQSSCDQLNKHCSEQRLDNNCLSDSVLIDNSCVNFGKSSDELKTKAIGNVFNATIIVNKLDLHSLCDMCNINFETHSINHLYS